MGVEKETEKKIESKMEEVVRERFSEIFLATNYATQDERKYALLECMEPNAKYTVKKLRDCYIRKYKLPISRVAINSYVNQLEAEKRVSFTRSGRGGTKIVTLCII